MEVKGYLYAVLVVLTSFAAIKDVGVLGFSVSIEPAQAMVELGGSIEILCRTTEVIQYCHFYLPKESEPRNLGPLIDGYFGTGLEKGQCGISLKNIQENMNGGVRCAVGVMTSSKTNGANMTLTVLRKPLAPELFLTSGPDRSGDFREGESLQASCKVRNGRPAPVITWYMGRDQLYDGLSELMTVSSIDGLVSVEQNLSRSLSWRDNSRELRCVLSHRTLKPRDSNQTSIQINVLFKPRDTDKSMEQFGFVIGKTGTVRKQVQANPRPRFSWNIGSNMWVEEGQSDHSGRFRAEPAINNGSGIWEAHLGIDGVTMEDVERVYILRASNSEGNTEYTVAISTSDAPTELEIGTGAIIGIVAAILVLLLVIFMLIFARATGRWCFAGGVAPRHDHRESSDTESAENGPSQKSKKPKMTLSYLFKKKKDKVADTEELKNVAVDDEKQDVDTKDTDPVVPTARTKQGQDVVYAELDLQSTRRPVVRREDERTEYAEIIHTKPGDADTNN